jgi:hypothetical protein
MTTAYTLQHEPVERWFRVRVSRAGSGGSLAVPRPRDSGTPKGRYSYAIIVLHANSLSVVELIVPSNKDDNHRPEHLTVAQLRAYLLSSVRGPRCGPLQTHSARASSAENMARTNLCSRGGRHQVALA